VHRPTAAGARWDAISQRNVARDLGVAADRAGLNPEGTDSLSCHDLRHTAISRWVALRAVAAGFAFALLGANTTLFVYVWPFFGLTEVAS
jgi:hypothetical protein